MRRRLGILIAAVLFIPVVVLAWLTTTQSGLHWAYQQVETYLPGKLTMAKLEGRLLGPVTATNIEYRLNGALIKVAQLRLEWSPTALLTTYIKIKRLHIQSLSITLPRKEKANSNQAQAMSLPEIHLPWRIALQDAVIDDLQVQQDNQNFGLQQIRIKASTLSSQVDIEELRVSANTFKLNIKGELQLTRNYPHELTTDWQTELPSGSIIKGHGQLAGDLLKTHLEQQLRGPLQATVDAKLTDLLNQLSWQVRMDDSSFDISKLGVNWPVLIGKLSLQGKGNLTSAALSGSITGDYPGLSQAFNAGFRLQLGWRDSGLDIALFNLHSGDTQFSAHGRVSKTLKLDWSVKAADLAKLYPHAAGQLRAKGHLNGPWDTPVIDATFKGKALSLPDYRLAGIDGAVDVDLFRWQHINIRLVAQALNFKGYALQSLQVNADRRHLKVKASSAALTAQIEIKGNAHASDWRGHIEHADIKTENFGDWQLSAPAALSVSKKTLLSDALCWHNHHAARFCASFQHDNRLWKSHLKMSKLPLMLFSPWLPSDLKLNGMANATAELQFQTPKQILGHADIKLTPGMVSYPLLEGERNQWEYRSGTLTATLDKQGFNAKSEIAMSNGDQFHLQAELPGAQLLKLDRQHQILRADAELRIHKLGLVEALIPEVQDLKGEFSMKLTARGTLAQPRLSGQGQLLNGALRIPRLGLSINQVTLHSQTDARGNFNFHLDAQSGSGRLAIQGQTILDKNAGWPTQLNIKGERFEVSRIPEARVLASPNLQIKIQHHSIDIKGDVHIPQARLQPKDTTAAVRVSPDAIIVGRDQTTKEKWSITTRIRLTLGDRVNFYGFGFEGRFDGSLLLEDVPGQVTIATGELHIPEGRYRAYGQNLIVEHGRILYAGGPLTNPGLDLRAVRHIGNITSGLRVRGNLHQPKIELFSIPAMGQTDILSYLLLGIPMENASGEQGAMMAKAALAIGLSGSDSIARTLGDQLGLDEMRVESSEKGDQASLVVGRYLSPRIYVSYGVGLLEAINTLSIRYQITDRWQLKAESGAHQGADLLYTIESQK